MWITNLTPNHWLHVMQPEMKWTQSATNFHLWPCMVLVHAILLATILFLWQDLDQIAVVQEVIHLWVLNLTPNNLLLITNPVMKWTGSANNFHLRPAMVPVHTILLTIICFLQHALDQIVVVQVVINVQILNLTTYSWPSLHVDSDEVSSEHNHWIISFFQNSQ